MNHSRAQHPRLFVFVHFVAAAGILLGGIATRSVAERMGGEPGWVMQLAALLCALEVGVGIGEWRGMRYANYVRARATTGA